jgi:hypothetical protein
MYTAPTYLSRCGLQLVLRVSNAIVAASLCSGTVDALTGVNVIWIHRLLKAAGKGSGFRVQGLPGMRGVGE